MMMIIILLIVMMVMMMMHAVCVSVLQITGFCQSSVSRPAQLY